MLSLFLEYPIVTGIAIVLALIFASVASRIDPRLGEIIGTNMVFPLVVFGIVAILGAVLAIGKALLLEKAKKEKQRARALKARNGKE